MEQLDTFQTLLIASSLDGGRDIPRGLIENLLKYVTPLPNVHLDNFVLSKTAAKMGPASVVLVNEREAGTGSLFGPVGHRGLAGTATHE